MQTLDPERARGRESEKEKGVSDQERERRWVGKQRKKNKDGGRQSDRWGGG